MRNHGLRRVVSLVLAVMMVCTLLPTAALADEALDPSPLTGQSNLPGGMEGGGDLPDGEDDPDGPPSTPVANEGGSDAGKDVPDKNEGGPGAGKDIPDKNEGGPGAGKDAPNKGAGRPDGNVSKREDVPKTGEADGEDARTFTVTYRDGADGEAFPDQVYSGLKYGDPTPAFQGTPARSGYAFLSWSQDVATSVTEDRIYQALWEKTPGDSQAKPAGFEQGGLEDPQREDGQAAAQPPMKEAKGRIANSTVVLHPSVGSTVTGVKVSVGSQISGYQVSGINGNDITVDLGKYNVNNESFTLPYAKDIWYGVDSNQVDHISWAGSGASSKSEGSSALLANGKNTAYYYFKGNPSVTYAIYYNTQGGTEVSPTVTTSTAAAVTLNVTPEKPTKSGFTFLGWAESGDEEAPNAKSSYTLTSRQPTMTLFALWQREEPEITYTVTYTDGVENAEVFSDDVHDDLKAGDPTPAFRGGEPTREGYEFTGWYPRVSDTVTGNAIYMATWEEKEIQPTAPAKPDGEAVEAFLENGAVTIDCVGGEVDHGSQTYGLISGTYTIGTVLGNLEEGYTCDITITDADSYAAKYSSDIGTAHTLSPSGQDGKRITLQYGDGLWDAVEGTLPVTFTVVCDTPKPQPVNVVVYRNGDLANPDRVIRVAELVPGATFNVDNLKAEDYYASPYGFAFDGFFSDGGFNDYKSGKSAVPLSGKITINGWTNLILVVTDYEKVIVKAVTDGDRASAVDIFSGKALHGADLLSYLNSHVTVAEKAGYTLDKWYNWDWYGHKLPEDATVNGWTNVYVHYTGREYKVVAKLYIDGKPAYYQNEDFYTTSTSGRFGETIDYQPIRDWAEAKAKALKAGTSATIFEATVYKDGGTYAPEETFGQWNPSLLTNYVMVDVTTKASAEPMEPVVYRYEVRHYLENLDGSFSKMDTDYAFGAEGTTVKATLREYENYTPGTAASGVVTKVTQNPDGTPNCLVLNQYYYRNRYTVTYTDGVFGSRVFADQKYKDIPHGAQTPGFQGTPYRRGYAFAGWYPAVADTVTGNVTYTAAWQAISSGGKSECTGGKLDSVPKTGDQAALMALGGMMALSFCGTAVVWVYDRKRRIR